MAISEKQLRNLIASQVQGISGRVTSGIAKKIRGGIVIGGNVNARKLLGTARGISKRYIRPALKRSGNPYASTAADVLEALGGYTYTKKTPSGDKYRVGSRAQVMNGTVAQSYRGETRSDLTRNKWGRIVNARKHAAGVRLYNSNPAIRQALQARQY
jgi:hypothetical protein